MAADGPSRVPQRKTGNNLNETREITPPPAASADRPSDGAGRFSTRDGH